MKFSLFLLCTSSYLLSTIKFKIKSVTFFLTPSLKYMFKGLIFKPRYIKKCIHIYHIINLFALIESNECIYNYVITSCHPCLKI